MIVVRNSDRAARGFDRGGWQLPFSMLGIFWNEEMLLLNAEKESICEMLSHYRMVQMTFRCCCNTKA